MSNFALRKIAHDKDKSRDYGHRIKRPGRQARKLDHWRPRKAPINERDKQNIKQRIFEETQAGFGRLLLRKLFFGVAGHHVSIPDVLARVTHYP